jgi:outer membrane protein assembly factor BamB
LAAAVLVTAAVLACGKRGVREEPAGGVVDVVPLGGDSVLVLREARRGPQEKEWRDEAALERAGKVVWRAKVALVSKVFERPADADDAVVVLGGQPPGSKLYTLQVLDRAGGKLLWSTAPRDRAPRWRLDRGDLFELTRTHLHGYDARSGKTRWSWKLPRENEVHAVILAADEVIVEGPDGPVRLSRTDGNAMPVAEGVRGACVVNGAVVPVQEQAAVEIHDCGVFRGRPVLLARVGDEERLVAIGEGGWSTELEHGSVQARRTRDVFHGEAEPWPARRPFQLAGGTSVAVADLDTGRVTWPPNLDEDLPYGQLVATGGVVLYGDTDLLATFDPATGAVARAVDIEPFTVAPHHVRDGRVYLLDGDRWRVLDARTLDPVDGGKPLPDRTGKARRDLGR